jgi:hypothetical protein
MSGAALKIYLADQRFWSFATIFLETTRASSYWFRPPSPAGPIEHLVPYTAWALLLLSSALLIAVGSLFDRLARLALLGHMIGVFCYLTFGSSIALDAIFNGQGWASMGSLYVVSVLHFGLCVAVGDRLGKLRREGEAAQS